MGQKHVVQVIKLITMGTLEEKIHHLQKKKQQMADDILCQDDASILKGMRTEELAGLLSMRG